jgi:hypothetical protein
MSKIFDNITSFIAFLIVNSLEVAKKLREVKT